ncbi:MAG: hypothetical protein JSW73_05530 [Candidatus Woesearchaeota archaeon]|nr:MAG: hypothetical protein JSW73_05530 [Candidatus Woesearchaeota archaeon]
MKEIDLNKVDTRKLLGKIKDTIPNTSEIDPILDALILKTLEEDSHASLSSIDRPVKDVLELYAGSEQKIKYLEAVYDNNFTSIIRNRSKILAEQGKLELDSLTYICKLPKKEE